MIMQLRLKICLWILDNIPLGPLAPWVFGLAIGRRPRRTGPKPFP